MAAIYLTFDDGPSAGYTPALLELLKRYNVKATFFVVGEFAKANPEIIHSEIQEGHTVCLHANQHISSWLMSRKAFEQDMDTALATLNELGIKPKYYRPPWGMTRSFSEEVARSRGLNLIKWDVMAEDWRATTGPNTIARKILERTTDHSVICLHDGRGRNHAPARTIQALQIAIPELLRRGYTFEMLR